MKVIVSTEALRPSFHTLRKPTINLLRIAHVGNFLKEETFKADSLFQILRRC